MVCSIFPSRFSQFSECYSVISDLEDGCSRTTITEEFIKEIRDHRLVIARLAQGTRFVEHIISDKEHPSKIVFRRQKPEEREKLCSRRVTKTRTEVDACFAEFRGV